MNGKTISDDKETTMTTETTPATAGHAYTRLREIAPWPAGGRDADPEQVARWLLVHAQREWTRTITPYMEPGGTTELDVTCVAKLNAQFAGGHALLSLIGTGREAQVATEIVDAWNDGGEVGSWLDDHLKRLGVDPGEVTRLAEIQVAADKAASDEEAAELAALRGACRTMGKVITGMAESMEAARIEMLQNGPEAAMQWILNAIPDVSDNDPEDQWDGTETAAQWIERQRAADRAFEAEATR